MNRGEGKVDTRTCREQPKRNAARARAVLGAISGKRHNFLSQPMLRVASKLIRARGSKMHLGKATAVNFPRRYSGCKEKGSALRTAGPSPHTGTSIMRSRAPSGLHGLRLGNSQPPQLPSPSINRRPQGGHQHGGLWYHDGLAVPR